MTAATDKLLLRNVKYEGRVYEGFPKIYNIYALGFVSCISGLMFGFDISSMSSMIGTEVYGRYFGHPDSTTQGGITASMAAGSFWGSLMSSYISDTFGRRVSLHACSSFWIVGAILQCASQGQAMLIAGRVIAGMGIGFGSSVAPIYCSEISPPKIRGAIGGIFQLCITIGIMVLFFIGYGCHFINGTAAFRITWGAQIVPGVLLLVAVFFLPESPRWLANRGRWEETEHIVAEVTAGGNRKDEQVLLQMEEIREQVLIDQMASNFGYKDLFRRKTLPKTIVGVCAQMWQQLCGMNVMMYYIIYIFDMAGFSGNTNLLSSAIQYILNVLMTIPALFMVDRYGRRPVLLAGGVLMTGWLFSVAGLLGKYSLPAPGGINGNDTVRIRIPEDRRNAARGVIACSYLFVCSFAPTWGVGIWIYCSEIFNNIERAKGSALCTAVNWAFNFALAMFVPSAFKNITWKTYVIFGIFGICLTIQTYFMFPETKGKTLEEIDQMWDSKIPAWQSASYVPHVPIIEDKMGNKVGMGGSSQHVENTEKERNPMLGRNANSSSTTSSV
ncbi:sugar porter family MFS transporter Ecym_1345 [Eremothecium cymbalariae DBVPG|uniref:Major facilitator superfamily (MFS) profile domain-containing protein n=1 Tax=Eremothecium cymbalariae (strain CBS 270.75 / DBVPG 7215 / KCTC 17166 / NRRL Y-17582) TaxID=931890 RepID=G8JNB5_ERECY|nr:hypothetical protein Ecym_1345 [Eremothecium cymbalariae DBVPG\